MTMNCKMFGEGYGKQPSIFVKDDIIVNINQELSEEFLCDAETTSRLIEAPLLTVEHLNRSRSGARRPIAKMAVARSQRQLVIDEVSVSSSHLCGCGVCTNSVCHKRPSIWKSISVCVASIHANARISEYFEDVQSTL